MDIDGQTTTKQDENSLACLSLARKICLCFVHEVLREHSSHHGLKKRFGSSEKGLRLSVDED